MIPFNQPFLVGKELFYIAKAVLQNGQLAGGGKFTTLCQSWLEENLLCKKALLTHSCTGALEMAAILCDIQPGDEIIMPSFTFVSTANAFVLRGGIPVFIDIRADTLNIDENLIEKAINKKTKAIVAVHYAGSPCEMDAIMSLANKYGLLVIEDAAQALYSRYRDKYLGTIGHFGSLSFHETKNIICGEGGSLLINDDKFKERAEIIWEKGTNRRQFFNGEIDKYTWVDIGSSYQTSEIIAAFLYAQLEQSKVIIEKRNYLCDLYRKLLTPLKNKNIITLPRIDKTSKTNGHIFFLLTHSFIDRKKLIAHLDNSKISAIFHYIPLHSSPAGQKFGRYNGKLNVTDDLSNRVLRLPLFYEMTEVQLKSTVKEIYNFYGIDYPG